MKSPLVYLTAVKLKNQIKGIFKKPAKLVYALFMAALLILMAISGGEEAGSAPVLRDRAELTAILALFYTFMFLPVFINGSAGNSPMFTLSDVTLLFPSPLSPRRILFYGLLRQMGISLLLGFFLLFQYSWTNRLYGVTYGELLLVVVGYALTLFLSQLCAMAVYTRTSGRENAGRIIKRCAFGLAALYALAAVAACRDPLSDLLSGSGDFQSVLAAGTSFFSTLPGLLFPVSGWTAGMAGSLLNGNFSQFWIFLGLTLLLSAALVLVILKSKTDYYEDVLETAETAQSAVTAQKEGQLQEAVPKHVKVGKTGLKKGWGASAIYYKHKVENRRSGVFFLSTMSLIFAAVIIGFSFFMRALDDGDGSMLAAVFAMGTYLQLFSSALGRFNRELTKPYLYLIPEPPLKKLLCALWENLISEAIEAVVIFVPAGLILGVSPLDAALCILARISFALLFTSGNVLVERVFGTVSSKTLIFLFYFLALILMAVPGIVAGALLAWLTSLGHVGFFLGMIAGNLPVSLLTLYLCRNLLQYAELNNR